MQVEIVHLKRVHIRTDRGDDLGIFELTDEWNGLKHYRRLHDGQVLIVDADSAKVVKASPGLIL